MWKPRIAQLAAITTATLAAAVLGASPAAALNPNGPVPIPIKKPVPEPYPISPCFSISAQPIQDGFLYEGVTVDGQCFVGGTTALIYLFPAGSNSETLQEVPVPANGTFSTMIDLGWANGTYNVEAVDPIGPSWESPATWTSVTLP